MPLLRENEGVVDSAQTPPGTESSGFVAYGSHLDKLACLPGKGIDKIEQRSFVMISKGIETGLLVKILLFPCLTHDPSLCESSSFHLDM